MTQVVLPIPDNKEKLADKKGALSGIRIARIATVPFFVISQLKTQIEAIAQVGASVTVVTSNGPELDSMKGFRGINCVAIEIPRSISLWCDLCALLRLFILFKREQIHIVHSTTPKAGLLTALAAFVAGVPVRLHTFTGQPWVNMHGIKRWVARLSDKLIGMLNTRCYADSASQRKYMLEEKILNEKYIYLIGEGSLAGVDTKRFDRSRFSADDCLSMRKFLHIPVNVPVFLFIGRITNDKGIRELMMAFNEIKTSGSDAHLILVGKLDDDSGVSGGASQDDISQYQDVHYVGYSESPERYLAISDVLCLPSYREGFGTVVIEAAAMGVPTVGTNIYGLSDAVLHGETGILVKPMDVNALKAALLELMNNNELRVKMGEAAKQRAKTIFEANKVNGQVIEEYLALLHGKG